MNKDYILNKIKINIFYNIYNSLDEENNEIIKNIFEYKRIKDNFNNYSEYNKILYEEMTNILLDCFKSELKVINKFFDNSKKDAIAKEISEFLNKYSIDNIKVEDVINTNSNLKFFYLMNYCQYLMEILEMIFDNDNYEKRRINYLNSIDGLEEKKLLKIIRTKLKV